MDIIRYANLTAEPWRNGGGVTREIARGTGEPAGTVGSGTGTDGAASAGGWDWRVSIAEVGKAGAFSAFPGMERVLTVIDGDLFLLTVDGVDHPLEKYRPFRFPGGATAAGALPTGDVRDLNVITRMGAFKGYTSIIELSKKRAHPVFAGQFGILLQGQATVDTGTNDNGAEALNRYDAVAGSDAETPEILGRGFLAVVSIDPVEG